MSRPSVDEDALSWAVRSSDPEFSDWAGLSAWLSADPARNRAYDAAMAAAADAAELLAESVGAEDVVVPFRPAPARAGGRRRVMGAGLALAASVAGALLVVRPFDRVADPPPVRLVETPAGRIATIPLPDGSRIEMAGGSRMRLYPTGPRGAALERGRAVFTMRHDEARPFSVLAGGHRIVDLGTVFEVATTANGTAVAVSEGSVVVDPARLDVRLEAGQAATLPKGAAPIREDVPPAGIAQWRNRLMTYRDAPLSRVAADLSTALGRTITLRPELANRRFSGSLVPATLRDRPDELAAVLGVTVRQGRDGWELHER